MLLLREVNSNDMMLIFNWSNDPAVRLESFNSEPILLENHKKWFTKVMDDNNILFYILQEDGKDVGQIRLAVENNTAVISYMISAEFRGRGLGKKIIHLAEERIKQAKTDVIYLKAEVKIDNKASEKVFVDNGFDKTLKDEYIEFIKKI